VVQFIKYDKDKNGLINEAEFHLLCLALGYAFTAAESKLAMKMLDVNGSGKVCVCVCVYIGVVSTAISRDQVEMNEFTNWWKRTDRWDALRLDWSALIGLVRVLVASFPSFFDSAVRQIAAESFNAYDSDQDGVLGWICLSSIRVSFFVQVSKISMVSTKRWSTGG